MKLILKIKRFNPETDEDSYFQSYHLNAKSDDRILDLLVYIKDMMDGTLSFRKSCAHGICGSDAMRINGKDRLACKTLVKDVADSDDKELIIEPLRHFPVQRDLVVDQKKFFSTYRTIKPFLINDSPVKEKERIQTPEERKKFDDATNCILCSSCYSACPIPETIPDFLGPSALTQAARFIDDSRDKGFQERLSVIDTQNGVWSCENHFECTKACPRSIKITKLINQTKRKIENHKKDIAQTG